MQEYSGAFEEDSAAGTQTEAECGVSWNGSGGLVAQVRLGMGTLARDLDLILHLHRVLSQKRYEQFVVFKRCVEYSKEGTILKFH